MIYIKGISASAGIAIAKAFKLTTPDLSFEEKLIDNPVQELNRLDHVIRDSKQELVRIQNRLKKEMDGDKAAILSAQILILSDPNLLNPIKEKIKKDNVAAEVALKETATMFIDIFKNMDNEYMRERAADIEDVTKRVMANLLGISFSDTPLLNEEVIIIATDLSPSETAQLDKQFVKGFSTETGGPTSHSAIIARSLDIPAIVGTKGITDRVSQGDMVIVDSLEGVVIIKPSMAELTTYRSKQASLTSEKKTLIKLTNHPTLTKDNKQIKLSGNIGNPRDVANILHMGGDAIGLYRTEFLYMNRNDLPSEEEQYNAYKSVLEKMKDKSVVFRTMDIGGDKTLHFLDLPKELNPALGSRAIRFCLKNEHIFRPQLRALLRASVYGNLNIIFPMIATLEELRKAKAILADEKKALIKSGVSVSNKIDIGIMVEIPSTAIIANQFAKEVDFFSIGTNDLIQYTMAADRMNESTAHLYQPYHPAILNLINTVIEAAHNNEKRVNVCGEMAADPLAIPILLSLGLDELSMCATSILPARSQIYNLSSEVLSSHKDEILTKGTAEEVLAFVSEIIE